MKRAMALLAVVVSFALASVALAQQQSNAQTTTNPLVRVLQSKGILSDEEAAMINQASSPSESNLVLARLLLSKHIISQQEYDQTVQASVAPVAAEGAAGARIIPAVLRTGDSVGMAGGTSPQAKKAPPAPAVIPAIAPIRVLAVDPPKREGLIPDIKIGPVRVKPYGFFKTSIVHDSSSPGGNDFPLPQLAADTGPDASPEFHIKARALRLGANFEWVDLSPNLALTGRVELDFEGNFSRVNNRNVSSVRSNAPQIRLGWVRLDYKASDKTTVFALFGQDWTPFGSSTLPNTIETTGVGIAYGSLYERNPQARFGLNYNVGGSRSVKIQPEFAIVLPAFGDLPADLANQLAFGERQGADSARPEVQGRFVVQFQLDKAPGVAPAQFIASFAQGSREAIVTAASVPAAFKAAFPRGAKVDSNRLGWSAEMQLPTRYVTLISKYYEGDDLRYYFAGQLLSNFNDTTGLTGVATGTSIDGASTVAFGLASGVPVVAPQRPVHGAGGFVELGFPLSRIFGADPAGRNNGWTLNLHAGTDQADASTLRKFSLLSGRYRSDWLFGNIMYKLNSWVTFAWEESLYRTRAERVASGAALPLYRGIPSREAHDVRSEFATIFTF